MDILVPWTNNVYRVLMCNQRMVVIPRFNMICLLNVVMHLIKTISVLRGELHVKNEGCQAQIETCYRTFERDEVIAT